MSVWRGVRLEACIEALGFGEGSLVDLADMTKQRAVLAAFLDETAHLAFPQPSGDAIAHSVQSMWQVYLYLTEVGTELSDPLTCRFHLDAHRKDILTNLTAKAQELREHWGRFNANEDREVPATFFDIFFADLNQKTKSIAFSKLFGPFHEREISGFQAELQGTLSEADVALMMQTLRELQVSTDPDDAAERTGGVRVPLLTA